MFFSTGSLSLELRPLPAIISTHLRRAAKHSMMKSLSFVAGLLPVQSVQVQIVLVAEIALPQLLQDLRRDPQNSAVDVFIGTRKLKGPLTGYKVYQLSIGLDFLPGEKTRIFLLGGPERDLFAESRQAGGLHRPLPI